ncbi:MAG: hypothetical protein ACRCTD_03140 [Beijerinckiaceae bacterium]
MTNATAPLLAHVWRWMRRASVEEMIMGFFSTVLLRAPLRSDAARRHVSLTRLFFITTCVVALGVSAIVIAQV